MTVFSNGLVPCKQKECNRLVYPGTGAKTDALCLSCYESGLDARAGVTETGLSDENLVAQVKGFFQARPFKPLQRRSVFTSIEQLFQAMTRAQKQELVDFCITTMSSDLPHAEDLAAALVCFDDGDYKELTTAFFDRRRFYPGQLYRYATKHMFREIRERIIWDTRSRRSLMAALAWMPFEKIAGIFAEMNAEPPEWAAIMKMSFRSWTQTAGWEWTYDEQRRTLFSESCFPMVEDPQNSLCVATDGPIDCGFCQKPMIQLFCVDGDQIGLEGFSGSISALTCEFCGQHGPIFTEWDESGTISWSPHNQMWSPPPAPAIRSMLERRFGARLGKVASPLRSTYLKLPVNRSQIGGLPTVMSRPQYPACPICDETMMFLGQLDANVFGFTNTAIFQTFTCKDCRVSATLLHRP